MGAIIAIISAALAAYQIAGASYSASAIKKILEADKQVRSAAQKIANLLSNNSNRYNEIITALNNKQVQVANDLLLASPLASSYNALLKRSTDLVNSINKNNESYSEIVKKATDLSNRAENQTKEIQTLQSSTGGTIGGSKKAGDRAEQLAAEASRLSSEIDSLVSGATNYETSGLNGDYASGNSKSSKQTNNQMK